MFRTRVVSLALVVGAVIFPLSCRTPDALDRSAGETTMDSTAEASSISSPEPTGASGLGPICEAREFVVEPAPGESCEHLSFENSEVQGFSTSSLCWVTFAPDVDLGLAFEILGNAPKVQKFEHACIRLQSVSTTSEVCTTTVEGATARLRDQMGVPSKLLNPGEGRRVRLAVLDSVDPCLDKKVEECAEELKKQASPHALGMLRTLRDVLGDSLIDAHVDLEFVKVLPKWTSKSSGVPSAPQSSFSVPTGTIKDFVHGLESLTLDADTIVIAPVGYVAEPTPSTELQDELLARGLSLLDNSIMFTAAGNPYMNGACDDNERMATPARLGWSALHAEALPPSFTRVIPVSGANTCGVRGPQDLMTREESADLVAPFTTCVETGEECICLHGSSISAAAAGAWWALARLYDPEDQPFSEGADKWTSPLIFADRTHQAVDVCKLLKSVGASDECGTCAAPAPEILDSEALAEFRARFLHPRGKNALCDASILRTAPPEEETSECTTGKPTEDTGDDTTGDPPDDNPIEVEPLPTVPACTNCGGSSKGSKSSAGPTAATPVEGPEPPHVQVALALRLPPKNPPTAVRVLAFLSSGESRGYPVKFESPPVGTQRLLLDLYPPADVRALVLRYDFDGRFVDEPLPLYDGTIVDDEVTETLGTCIVHVPDLGASDAHDNCNDGVIWSFFRDTQYNDLLMPGACLGMFGSTRAFVRNRLQTFDALNKEFLDHDGILRSWVEDGRLTVLENNDGAHLLVKGSVCARLKQRGYLGPCIDESKLVP